MSKLTQHPISSILLTGIFFCMLFMPKQVFRGAEAGLLLWFQTILPTLLPFSIISNILIETNSMSYISNALSPVLQPVFRVSKPGVFAIVIGFLCGYPLGAKVIGQFVSNGTITKAEGNYLLSFCNNVSPIFLVNYLTLHALKRPDLIFPVLFLVVTPPVFCSFIFRGSLHYSFRSRRKSISDHVYFQSGASSQPQTVSGMKPLHLSQLNHCMMDSFEMMVYLGGYIMIFSILFQLSERLIQGTALQYLLPFWEITNGIALIQEFPISGDASLIFSLAVTSFGGICAVAQTKMVLHNTGLSVRSYTIKKLVTMAVTSLFTVCYLLLV